LFDNLDKLPNKAFELFKQYRKKGMKMIFSISLLLIFVAGF
jgi:hypothetical protein